MVNATSLIGLGLTYDLIWLTKYDGAVCNNGDTAGYYYYPGDRDTNTWLVYLAGGDWCWDDKSCIERCSATSPTNPLCGAEFLPETVEFQGVMNPRNESSVLGKAHKVFVPYCSSDGHMGNAIVGGVPYRGAVIVESVLKDLVKKTELGGQKGQQVIFGGISAGARGAMVHLDYVQEYIAHGGAQHEVEVLGLLDSPLWMDVPPMPRTRFNGFRHSCRSAHKYFNVTLLGKHCERSFPAQQKFKCLMGEYRLPEIKTRYFLVASQFDSFQLMHNMGSIARGEEDRKYLERWQERVMRVVWKLGEREDETERNTAFYSPRCFIHALTGRDEGWYEEIVPSATFPQKEYTIDEAFDQWLNYDKNVRTENRFLDVCDGINCGHCQKALEPADPDKEHPGYSHTDEDEEGGAEEEGAEKSLAAPMDGRSLALSLAAAWLTTLLYSTL